VPEPSMLLFGAASFGTADDINYVLETYPEVKDFSSSIIQAFLGALENNNPVGAEMMEDLIVISEEETETFYNQALASAARGDNQAYVDRYMEAANKPIPALLAAVANGNLDMVKSLQENKIIHHVPDLPLYAAYSGSSDMISHFITTPSVKETKQLAYGAAAGGNWNYLEMYLEALDDLRKSEKNALLTQILTELISHSQLSLFELMYSNLKDRERHEELRNMILDAFVGQSLLTELKRSTIHPAMTRRVTHILG
jgi:hypothetical protein